MNIKTITCHDVYNYGASLQAYALQKYLESLGHEVEIIDYKPTYKHPFEWTSIEDNGFLYRMSYRMSVMKPVLALIQHRHWIKYIPMLRKFDSFKKIRLKCTKSTYRTYSDFLSNPIQTEILIAGSDQIWNTHMLNGLDPVYYCMFHNDDQKAISYAASFAINDIDNINTSFVKNGLSFFDRISVREKSGQLIANRLGYDAAVVLDPVFLLDKQDWLKIMAKNNENRYLLVYDFQQKDPEIEKISRKIAKERNLKIYSIYTEASYADKNIFDAGPEEFLNWINGANLVVSNSFHATSFSIIFKKDFYTIPLLGHKNSSRMYDLLHSIGLESRFVRNVEEIKSDNSVDYSACLDIVNNLVRNSKTWLKNNIEI